MRIEEGPSVRMRWRDRKEEDRHADAPWREGLFDEMQLARLEQLARLGMRISRPWTGLMLGATLLSAFNVKLSAEGDVSASFGLSSLSAVFAALVWLPALLRILALAGGVVKTPAGEATITGLSTLLDPLPPDQQRETIQPLISALSAPQVLVDRKVREQSRQWKRELELRLATVTPRHVGIRETLAEHARRYEQMRATEPPGDRRTRMMTTLTAEARAAARLTPPSNADLRNMLVNGSVGERVVALAIIQDRPDGRLLDLLLDAITRSKSAFEQYQALAAVHETLPHLSREERDKARREILAACEDDDRDINGDASRKLLVDAILYEIAR